MIEAVFTDGDALICVIPSKSKNGVYLVKVLPDEDALTVTHSCPAHRFGNECSHIQTAVDCYREWRWWKKPLSVRAEHKFVVLDPNWDQVPVPGGATDTILHVLGGDPNAS